MILKRMKCCGIGEISNLSSWFGRSDEDIIYIIGQYHSRWAIKRGLRLAEESENRIIARTYRLLTFTEAKHPLLVAPGYGTGFAQLIERHGLGKVWEIADWGRNPNSSNDIKVWMWEIDHTAFWTKYAEIALSRMKGKIKAWNDSRDHMDAMVNPNKIVVDSYSPYIFTHRG